MAVNCLYGNKSNMLNRVYREYGNNVIEIPYYPDSKERRVDFVLDYIANDKNVPV